MKKLSELMSTLALLIVLAMTVLLLGMRLIGLTPYAVLSGSMEPAYSAGDLLYVKAIEPKDVEVGMPITFVANEQLTVVTHRVTDIRVIETTMQPIALEDGTPAVGSNGQPLMQEVPLDEPAYYFITKGDANENEDGAAVYGKNILGTPAYRLPFLGHLIIMLRTTSGKVMLGCFGTLLAVLLFLPEMLQAIERSDNNKEETAEVDDEEDRLVVDSSAKGEDIVLAPENEAGEDRLIT